MKTETQSFGRLTLVFTCEECEGKYLDTKVQINGETLCWITWDERLEFATTLQGTINKHCI